MGIFQKGESQLLLNFSPEDDDILEVTLSAGKTAWINRCDAKIVLPLAWWQNSTSGYACSEEGTKKDGRRKIWMHRLIMGAPDGIQIDHINGNKMDNRRSNLRFATVALNCRNTRRKKPQSGFHGVYPVRNLTKSTRVWKAIIGVDNQLIYLGVFDDPAEASMRYEKAKARLIERDAMHSVELALKLLAAES